MHRADTIGPIRARAAATLRRALVAVAATTVLGALPSASAAPTEILAQPPSTDAAVEDNRRLLEPPPPECVLPRTTVIVPPPDPQLLAWSLVGIQLVLIVAVLSYAWRQHQRVRELLDEQSRMKSYVALLRRGATRLPPGDPPPAA